MRKWMTFCTWKSRKLFVMAGVALLTKPLAAQANAEDSSSTSIGSYAIGLSAGSTWYDLSGTGSARAVAVRLEYAAKRWLTLEASNTTFRTQAKFDISRSYNVVDFQTQFQMPDALVRPYLGIGCGSVFTEGASGARVSLSSALGLRFLLPRSNFDTKSELKVRSYGSSFAGSSFEASFGVAYRF